MLHFLSFCISSSLMLLSIGFIEFFTGQSSTLLFTSCITNGLSPLLLQGKISKMFLTISHAFHPLDGFSQSVPYHIFVFIFPLNKFVYLALFILVNVWTVSIHDNNG